jgi:hypothetical protein
MTPPGGKRRRADGRTVCRVHCTALPAIATHIVSHATCPADVAVSARRAGREAQSSHLDGRDLPRSALVTASDRLPFELQLTTMILHTHRSPYPSV